MKKEIEPELEWTAGGPEQGAVERPGAANRRHDLLSAAFDIIAEVGFEGLRTRAVADKAGVNVATLHYYFPTKEALIWALAEFLGGKFMSVHAQAVEPSGRPSLDRLRQEFADTRYYMAEHSDLMRVMGELGQRAYRDETVRNMLQMMVGHWRVHLGGIIAFGVADGTFRADLDKEQATTTLIAIFAGMPSVGIHAVEPVQKAVEQWLIREEVAQANDLTQKEQNNEEGD